MNEKREEQWVEAALELLALRAEVSALRAELGTRHAAERPLREAS